jgi:hypothetical protein
MGRKQQVGVGVAVGVLAWWLSGEWRGAHPTSEAQLMQAVLLVATGALSTLLLARWRVSALVGAGLLLLFTAGSDVVLPALTWSEGDWSAIARGLFGPVPPPAVPRLTPYALAGAWLGLGLSTSRVRRTAPVAQSSNMR